MKVERSLPQEHKPLQDEGHPDSGDQGRHPRRVAERSIRDSLDRHVDRATDGHRCEEDKKEWKDDGGGAGLAFVGADDREQEERDESTECE